MGIWRGRTLWLAVAMVVLWARPAAAVQIHGEAEGLIAHQLGHVLFFSGMLFLLVRSRLSHWAGPGWAAFRGFLICTMLWNVVTFSGHWMQLLVPPERYLQSGVHTVGLRIESLFDLVFYLTRLDHLFLLPALLLLAGALRAWSRYPGAAA